MEEEIVQENQESPKRNLARNLAGFVIVFTVFLGLGFYGVRVGKIPSLPIFDFLNFRRFPEASQPREIILNCTYGGHKYVLKETFYGSVYDYYRTDPKKNRIFLDEDYGSFVFNYPGDQALSKIVGDIRAQGEARGLRGDQIADLSLCFVQNIPYDTEKAQAVLSTGDSYLTPNVLRQIVSRYPYETLYDNKGICTDKTYLAAAFLRELGYGTAVLTFDTDKHMAVGIKAPAGYASFGSEYSFVETTNTGYKVGQLPVIDKEKGLADDLAIDFSGSDYKISQNDSIEKAIPEIKEGNISNPSKVIKVSDGINYDRIIELSKRQERIKSLVTSLNVLHGQMSEEKKAIDTFRSQVVASQGDLKRAEAEVASKEREYKERRTTASYSAYLSAYGEYKGLYSGTKAMIDTYNARIADYNQLIERFNSLVGEYNRLIKLD